MLAVESYTISILRATSITSLNLSIVKTILVFYKKETPPISDSPLSLACHPSFLPFCWHCFWTRTQGPVEYRSVGGATVTSLQKNCRWRDEWIWLSPEVVTCSCRWSILVFADGHNRKTADDSEGKRGGCWLICSGVRAGYKGVVLYFP